MSTWNTPLERVRIQRQATGRGYNECWMDVKGDAFKGVEIRMCQSAALTFWMVVIPNLAGF